MPSENRNYDRKIFRLVKILNYLDRGRKSSTRELAEEFNVTPRTIQRDLELLNMTGFPIVSEGGRHSFMQGFSLRRVMLSNEEASLLSLLYEIASELGDNFKKSFQNILKRILKEQSESPFYVKMPQGIKLARDFPYLETLKEAVNDTRKIKISYLTHSGRIKEYTIQPLKILFFDGFWYLLAQKDREECLLKFRLERIKEVEILEDYFKFPESLKLMLEESVNIWFGEKRDKKVVLKVDKDVASFFRDKKYFPTQKLLKKNKDGSLIIESRVSQYMEILPTILSWIPFIVVVKPKELKKEVKKIVEKYLRKVL